MSYDLSIQDAFNGETRTPFDLYFLDNEQDYNCYIEKVTKWIDFDLAETCDFVRPGAEQIKESIFEYESEDNELLSYDQLHSDLFLVIDNSGWLAATQGLRSNGHGGTAVIDITVGTKYSSNDFYKRMYKFSLICIAALAGLIVILCIAYHCQTRKYSKYMDEKKEFKQQQLLKKSTNESRALFS